MAKTKAQQAAIAISMKKAGKKPKTLTKAQEGGGTYMTFKNGRIGRTYGLYGPYESIDTTGYSKNKKEFELKSSLPGYKPTTTKIKREDVPKTIENLKKGATGIRKFKKGGVIKSKKK